ncbi:MAG: hypothetical protein BWX88_01252 [Planctomycetes bacterium ADurb.Bin126]|nr:MAG: hypothetical protein BWX88_01252 [Planctomycetes bacterium ADurb.Bin126]HOD83758.1 hypothetical protein [Phycisphaerae bacterium]HQL74483.1 hypothetical protein [Phycisphaerae bacterium]
MTEPLSLIAVAAAVGGAAGKFVEKAWESGEKWIKTYFADHRPKAIAQANANSASFLQELAQRIKALEDGASASKPQIESAQDHPEFSVALQRAVLTAAQTEDPEKHQLLARVLADRLAAKPEGMRAMAAKLAIDAIGLMTPGQLRLLGLVAEIRYIRPMTPLQADTFREWFDRRFSPYVEVSFNNLDLLHLEALSCLRSIPFISRDLRTILKEKVPFEIEPVILEGPPGSIVMALWNRGLQSVDLTSVGQLLGVYVSDLLTGTTTEFTGWN